MMPETHYRGRALLPQIAGSDARSGGYRDRTYGPVSSDGDGHGQLGNRTVDETKARMFGDVSRRRTRVPVDPSEERVRCGERGGIRDLRNPVARLQVRGDGDDGNR